MDLVHVIRHKYYQEGLSGRQISRDTGCSRNTVSKYLEQAEPVYKQEKRRAACSHQHYLSTPQQHYLAKLDTCH